MRIFQEQEKEKRIEFGYRSFFMVRFDPGFDHSLYPTDVGSLAKRFQFQGKFGWDDSFM